MKAQDLLNQAAAHMAKRAKQYDRPDGERSVPAVVDAFNAIKGGDRMLSHADGWLFLTLLKLVRGQSATGIAAFDSAEDAVAYAALFGEELLRGQEPHQVGAIQGTSCGQANPSWPNLKLKPDQCTGGNKRGLCYATVPCDCDPLGQR